MAEVKWIKITTNMFEDEKIDFRELPEADAILVVWIKLLTLAGKTNANGYIFLTEKIPYTTEMLAHKFRRPLNTIKLALETLRNLEMISFDDNNLKITNWEKHQNIQGLEKIREQTRKRVAKHREKQKLISSNVTSNDTVTQDNATELELELELDKERDKDIYRQIEHLILTVEDYNKLLEKYYKQDIDNVLDSMENWKGIKKKKSAYLTALNWLRRDKDIKTKKKKVIDENPFLNR